MKGVKSLVVLCGLLLALGLAGCQRTPEDIEKWKAAGNTAKLVEATEDARQFMRLAAIEALAELKDPEAIPPLTSLFADPDLVIVHEAVEAIASIGGPLSEQSLLQALALKTYPARATAAKALGELKSEKAAAPLIKALDDPYEEVVIAAAAALGSIGSREAIPALNNLIQTGSSPEKTAVAKSLSLLGGEDAVKGLEQVFDEMNPEIREIAVHAFIKLGEPAMPYAYDALRSESRLVQQCGMSILQGLDAVPTAGNYAVWYQLARTSIGEQDAVDPDIVDRLVQMGESAIPPLLEGVASPSRRVRETASRALEDIGEPAAALALAAARKHAAPDAQEWLDQRHDWCGAPSWRLDLWGAVTALSPDFTVDLKQQEMLGQRDANAAKIMAWSGFRPDREYVPLLISQFRSGASPGSSSISFFGLSIELRAELLASVPKTLMLASEWLEKAGESAVFPLIAGLSDEDPQVSDGCAHVLGNLGDSRATRPLIAHLKKKIEAGESLTHSPFYIYLLTLNDPSAQETLIKVRPHAERAKLLFRDTYPAAEILHLPAAGLIDTSSQSISFTIEYRKEQQTGKLTVTFRKTVHGDWIPYPPLPDSLPE